MIKAHAFPEVHNSVLDNVMLTLEQTAPQVPVKQDGWANLDQLKRVATYNGVGYGFITSRNMNELVELGRAERKIKGTVAYWRPSKGGGGKGNILDLPSREPGYPGQDRTSPGGRDVALPAGGGITVSVPVPTGEIVRSVM